jgi:hypothetical protein
MVKKVIKKHIDMDKRKLIIANKSSFKGVFIDDGKLSLTGSDKFYIMGDNLDIIYKLLSFKICDIISHFTKYRQDFLEKEVFRYIPDIRKFIINNDITEQDFYNLIGLTQEELILIDYHPQNDNIQLQTQQLQTQQPQTQQPQTQQLQTQQLQTQQPQQLQHLNFNKMTIPQLKGECKNRNLKNYSKLNKQPLLEFLLKNI